MCLENGHPIISCQNHAKNVMPFLSQFIFFSGRYVFNFSKIINSREKLLFVKESFDL